VDLQVFTPRLHAMSLFRKRFRDLDRGGEVGIPYKRHGSEAPSSWL